jgi:hypothetical protein
MWDVSNTLYFGNTDGGGVPNSGSIFFWTAASGSQSRGSNFWISTYNGNEFYLNCDSSGNKIIGYRAQYYDLWNGSSGTRQWISAGAVGMSLDVSANLILYGQGYKPGGGAWADSSDARIKTVTGDYEGGLDAILGLQPRRFTLKGNWINAPGPNIAGAVEGAGAEPDPNGPHDGAADAGTEFVGLVAQEAEIPMPEMVSKKAAYIDGKRVDDMRVIDTTALPYALVNAVKELAGRVTALEAAGAPA